MPLATSPLISSEGCGSITATCFASSPCSSQPDSIVPPIFPAPARTIVALSWASECACVSLGEVIRNKYHRIPAKAGTIATNVSISLRHLQQACAKHLTTGGMGPRLALAMLAWLDDDQYCRCRA